MYQNEHHGSIISTRHYRAPEVCIASFLVVCLYINKVLLQMGWSYPADIWSVGCILIELFTGKSIFLTHHNLEHLAMIQKVIGPIDSAFLKTHVDAEGRAKQEILHYFTREKEGDEVRTPSTYIF